MSDQWDFHFCNVEGKPASIFVDMGLHDEAPLDELIELTWLQLSMRDPRPDGLPGPHEFESLKAVQDALSQAASEMPQAVYVGRSTSDGCRTFFYYSGSGIALEARLSQAMAAFGEYEFETDSRPEADWTVYFDFLYPSPRAKQAILNRGVLEALASGGDIHETPRTVCHYLYFESAAQRAACLEVAVQKAYDIDGQTDDAKSNRPNGLTLSHVTPVDESTINRVVLELFDLALEWNGEYDGWETSVETGDSRPAE